MRLQIVGGFLGTLTIILMFVYEIKGIDFTGENQGDK